MAKVNKNNCSDAGPETKENVNKFIQLLSAGVFKHESINKIYQQKEKIEKHFKHLSKQRDVYTIQQAAFRLNCSRNEFEKLFVKTGKIKLQLTKGNKYVLDSEIQNHLQAELKNQNSLK